MKSIPYMHPMIYNLYLLALHRRNLGERYKLISGEIGYNKIIFELGCGTGILTDYLDKSCNYIGWDLNRTFIQYLKRKGQTAELHDIFDFSNYPENDVCVIVDILHHVVPKEHILIKNALKLTKKLIVVEPHKAFCFPLPDPLRKYYDSILGDNDGINPYRDRVNWNYSPEELKKYFLSSGARKVTEVGKDIMAVFYFGKNDIMKANGN
ncbi:MAG: class I SAM-dependent methyltransferase [Candidatus Thermoplasmatota archaeon]|nr:class I SAM-dependent methyltransferase [Candidatus Thermoplasmatota archaeon]